MVSAIAPTSLIALFLDLAAHRDGSPYLLRMTRAKRVGRTVSVSRYAMWLFPWILDVHSRLSRHSDAKKLAVGVLPHAWRAFNHGLRPLF
jgi:hypothetical protein